jgi:hypothetical protein
MSGADKREWMERVAVALRPLGELACPPGARIHPTWWRVYCWAMRGHLALWRLGVRL